MGRSWFRVERPEGAGVDDLDVHASNAIASGASGSRRRAKRSDRLGATPPPGHEIGEAADLQGLPRVSDGTRTRDRRDHNPELYQLSYAHQGTARPI